MSTLANEPLEESLEAETTGMDLVDESVNTMLVAEVDETDNSKDAIAAANQNEAVDLDAELTETEPKSEAVADVIELKPEDLADIKSKVDGSSEEDTNDVLEVEAEVVETEVIETETVKAESVESGVEASEEDVAEDIEEDSDAEAKPSRSRALLLTSLLSTTKPISKKELKKVLKLPEKAVLAAIEDLKTTLYEQDLGLMMEEVAGGYRVIIQPNLYTDLAALISPPPLPQLSSAALETLAIISYKQPITRGELEAARGTGCSSTLDTLQERDLIKILGQKDVVGKPLLYGTTERFLLEFGLKSLEDLPPLDEKPTEFLRS